jgi:acyl-[acyl-carrier-protein]-phospholipid O-acyltransferase/long-chain-fatty-acid--[acyl-carrier-protein] ligase
LDAVRGEKLIAVTNEPRLTLEAVRTALHARGLGNLAVPRDLKVLPDLPRLGSGKINHRELERLV